MGQQRDQGRNQDTLKQMKLWTQQSKSCGRLESNLKMEIHSIRGLSQKTRKSSNKQSNFIVKGT